MNTFRNALINQANVTTTENGMGAFKSSLNANVDLFFAIGASRGKDVTNLYRAALAENRELAIRMLLWVRDAREGAGERQTARNILQFLENHDDAVLLHVLPMIPEMGRWDDLLVFKSTQWKNAAFSMIQEALANGNGLCAKWMPRKGQIAVELRNFMGLSPKEYRKGLVNLTNVVEQQMCAKEWDKITFDHVPSVASARYQKAFGRNCGQRYVDYKQGLANGLSKVNAKAIFPYDVIRGGLNGDKVVAEAQWNSLPNFIAEGSNILPMIDVSDSMTWFKVSGSLVPRDVAISLGLYAADKQKGPFKNLLLKFSSDSKLFEVTGGLFEKYRQVMSHGVGGSTNIESAFNAVLNLALKNNVPQADMPTHILIFSDMQFDQATGYGYRTSNKATAQEMIKQKYANAGYEVPKIIYWNLHARGDNTPVKYDANGVGLVSGFSPSLMTTVLSSENITPESIMLNTLMQPRYDFQ